MWDRYQPLADLATMCSGTVGGFSKLTPTNRENKGVVLASWIPAEAYLQLEVRRAPVRVSAFPLFFIIERAPLKLTRHLFHSCKTFRLCRTTPTDTQSTNSPCLVTDFAKSLTAQVEEARR